MRPRPLAEYSALQRDLLHAVRKNPGANSAELHRALEAIRDQRHDRSTSWGYLQEFADAGLVEKNGDRQERSYRLTDAGRELLDEDLDWQRDR